MNATNTPTDRKIKSRIKLRLKEAKRLEAKKLQRDREYDEEMRMQHEAEAVGENYWDENPAINY